MPNLTFAAFRNELPERHLVTKVLPLFKKSPLLERFVLRQEEPLAKIGVWSRQDGPGEGAFCNALGGLFVREADVREMTRETCERLAAEARVVIVNQILNHRDYRGPSRERLESLALQAAFRESDRKAGGRAWDAAADHVDAKLRDNRARLAATEASLRELADVMRRGNPLEGGDEMFGRIDAISATAEDDQEAFRSYVDAVGQAEGAQRFRIALETYRKNRPYVVSALRATIQAAAWKLLLDQAPNIALEMKRQALPFRTTATVVEREDGYFPFSFARQAAESLVGGPTPMDPRVISEALDGATFQGEMLSDYFAAKKTDPRD